jgi:hypothetical protein
MSEVVSDRPDYVYVASSWRNPMQPGVVAALRAAGIDCYDFRNPEGGTGFSWKEVTPRDATVTVHCEHCGKPIVYSTFRGMGAWEPDYDPSHDPEVWRHQNGYAACNLGAIFAAPKKGSDLVDVGAYLEMLTHPRAIEGYDADFAAMEKADTFVLVLPCGRSAHLELGWAVGAGKRTAILLEDPAEPELMYRMVDYLAPSLFDLLGWLGVED